MYTPINASVHIANTNDPEKNEWLNLPIDEDELNEALERLGVYSDEDDEYEAIINGGEPKPHYIILQWNDDEDLLEEHLAHNEDIFHVSDIVEQIEALDRYDREKMMALIEDGEDLDDAAELATDGDIEFYSNTSLPDLAEEFASEEMFSREYLLQHIDWSSVARDLEYDGYREVNGGVLFRR